MKVGDLVKWIGHSRDYKSLGDTTGPTATGIIVEIIYGGQFISCPRIDVAWGDGTFGRALYSSTLEIINEA